MSLLLEQANWRPNLDGLAFDSLDPQSARWLEWPSGEDEIHNVIRRMAKDKARRPDGFSMSFFLACWDIVKEDVLGLFHEFHSFMKFKNASRRPSLLLSKKNKGFEGKVFLTHKSCEWVYKILSKVLTNRMNTVMEQIISKP